MADAAVDMFPKAGGLDRLHETTEEEKKTVHRHLKRSGGERNDDHTGRSRGIYLLTCIFVNMYVPQNRVQPNLENRVQSHITADNINPDTFILSEFYQHSRRERRTKRQ